MTELLRVEHLSKSFGGLNVTRDLSFVLEEGDRTALIGPNGAGKTTLVNQLSGALPPTSGSITFQGRDITRESLARRARFGLVRTFQISRLFSALTVFENIALPILERERQTGRTLRAFATPSVKDEALDLIAMLGLSEVSARRVADIAYGPRRLVELAMALALKPKVLLMDEPAAGVGSSEVGRILEAMSRLAGDIGILLIDHDMDLVFQFARSVMVMAEGALIFHGSPADAAEDSRVRDAYLGSFAHERRVA